MSAILSADDLNDFISPGVACIKPIETLPVQKPEDDANAYEVTTEDKVAASIPPPPAQISLTDCLACSGCVTSAEAVLVSLQSHTEVLNTLDAHPSIHAPWLSHNGLNGTTNGDTYTSNGVGNGSNGIHTAPEGKLFVASVSPQTRASLAATFAVSESQAGNMISQLLSGPMGLKTGGAHGSSFTWVIDTNVVRDACLVSAADEVLSALSPSTSPPLLSSNGGAIDTPPKKPILTSACPGWICYAEKTHPYVLPHLSRLKSPQALAGTLLKSVLSRRYNIPASQIWHLAIMPCFDKKLEASRSELTSAAWAPSSPASPPIRDVDCVITARELLHLASTCAISFAALPRTPLPPSTRTAFPDGRLDAFLFPRARGRGAQDPVAGSSGGYLHHILRTAQAQHPGSTLRAERGRNADVVEYTLTQPGGGGGAVVLRMARYYGFRNIQNLVRRLKPAKASRMPGAARGVMRRPGGAGPEAKEYAYVEVMACPGGCTNGGGQVRAGEVEEVRGEAGVGGEESGKKVGPVEQKEWLGRVDEAYFSAGSDEGEDGDGDTDMGGADDGLDVVDGVSRAYVHGILQHWAELTGVSVRDLVYTSYREVESDVGKKKSDVERVATLASSMGGGW
ncbi:iron hydrogenase [Mytilinidion resinicola]|uniref:Nuclear architecture-related protein 1 n=1 Tax=Mytilinidion resinicola TaxID=574789 RepID=A0A6A6YY52_9PEZI|nr:iron hydrogenase [Mytilinidion resinicola]KAF2813363.1 iron hydrogenase [Mytilinidion resinicola]